MDRRTRILIVNDTNDCGMPYEPTFSSFGEVVHDKAMFKLQPLTFKLIVFTGGADVSPSLYGDTSPQNICHSNTERDKEEVEIFKFGEQRGIKMVGICRGMQFLNVMTGGKMIHDVTGHSGGNHQVMTKERDVPFITNSYHHQMCIPNISTYTLAWSNQRLSRAYIGDKDESIVYTGPEVEAIYMPYLKAIGVQWHPECMPNGEAATGRSWFMHLVKDLLARNAPEMKKLYLGMEGAKLSVTEVR